MHTLHLLRHAKSSWADAALPDHERPLAPRGRRDANLVAGHLRREGIEPEEWLEGVRDKSPGRPFEW